MGKTYTDFELSMIPNANGDIKQLSDEECIIQSIKNACNLNSFDIPFDDSYSANIRKFLFDNPDKIRETEIKKSIKKVLSLDTRLSDPTVNITYTTNFQVCYIDVSVYVVILGKTVTYQLTVEKAR